MKTSNPPAIEISLPDIVGRGYASFWRTKKRYRVNKGGRASKKSRTAGLWYIYNMMKHPLANTLVVRNTFNTHKDSTFAVLKWAAERLKVSHLWQFKESPLEAIYKPTGQKILFRGFDDPIKLASITVSTGYLCWVWVEEAFEIDSEEEFRTLDESIRGDMPAGLWKQLTLTYNPWVDIHWTKKRFFDNVDPDAFTLTTTYRCNEWLDEADRKLIEDLRESNPERYKVVGLGEYGLPGGAAFDEFSRDVHVCTPFVIPQWWRRWIGHDPGYNNPFAWYWLAVSPDGIVYVYREYTRTDDDPQVFYSDQGARVRELSTYTDDQGQAQLEKIDCIVAGLDAFAKSRETGKTYVDYYQEGGLPLEWPFYKATTDRALRATTWHEYLKPFPHPEFTGKQTAKVQIFSTCKRLIETLPMLQKDEKDPEKVADNPKIDNGYDGAGYGLLHYHAKASIEPPPPPKVEPEPFRSERPAKKKGWSPW